ncbi:MAG: hypothetical protein CL927_04245 [Deltaproteobacteria bacterium]|nr:hypothetical protein [Deltaproteobacteria bacterium]HCH66955.1 hypothetical protein [Deltaproteobacteria bacterium]
MPIEASATSPVDQRVQVRSSAAAPSVASPELAGAMPLGMLALAFCALPAGTWLISGHWVPEVMVFGLAAGLVALVSRNR